MRLKIRTKLILSFFTPIIPLVAVVIIISVYILNNLYNEAQRLDSISKEMIKVADLRLSLDRILMPVNDYIITGARKYVDDFNGISKEVEERLKTVEDLARTPEEREILKDVKSSWQDIGEISLKIFAISDPFGSRDAARLMEEMDYKWGYPAIERLNRWREIDLEGYKIVLEKHNMAWMRLWTVIIIASISFPLLCLLYILYYSSRFVKSIDVLKNGAKTIADGNLDEHIDLHTGDEIEELSALFNSMADNLKKSYTSLEDRVTERTRELKEREAMLQKSFRSLSTLYNIDRSVSQSLDLDELLKNGLSMTLKTLEIEGGAITLIDPDGKTMTIRTYSGLSEEFVKNVRHINIDEGISGRAIAGKKPVILNISEYPTERLAPFIKKEGFQTLVSTPLISAGKVFGALTLATHKIKAFPPEETELLTSIGIQLGTAVQNALLFQSVQKELSERKRAEESLKVSEERYRGLVETSTDAIVSVNDAREIIQWNDSASRIFGYSKDEIMGKLSDTIVPEEYQNRHIEGFKRYIETGEGKIIGKTAELKGLRKDGFIVPIELSLSVLKSDKSYIFTGIIRDITERKRAEQEMIQQQKLATMGHLVSGITHEIKNPLGIISGYIQMLNMDEQDAEKKKIYETVLQQIDRSTKIIDNLLGFARRREHEIKDISINNLIESTIRLVEYEMRLENIIFVRDFSKDLPLIKGDLDQLAQVFLNLINNARDSMNEKQKRIKSGELKIEGWKGEVRITTKKTNNRIEITFADTGLGILEDKIDMVFKPFFTTKPEGKGTGLGLSIAKDIIEKHGGKIELENMGGEGVKFIIRLPISSPL